MKPVLTEAKRRIVKFFHKSRVNSFKVTPDSKMIQNNGNQSRTLYYISPQDPESAYSAPYAITNQPRKIVLMEEAAYQYARQYCPEKLPRKNKHSAKSGWCLFKPTADNLEESRHCTCFSCLRPQTTMHEDQVKDEAVAVIGSSDNIHSTGQSRDQLGKQHQSTKNADQFWEGAEKRKLRNHVSKPQTGLYTN